MCRDPSTLDHARGVNGRGIPQPISEGPSRGFGVDGAAPGVRHLTAIKSTADVQAFQGVDSAPRVMAVWWTPSILASRNITWNVFGPPKSKAGRRTMFMPAVIVEMLRSHLERSGQDESDAEALVFTDDDGGALRYSNWRRRTGCRPDSAL